MLVAKWNKKGSDIIGKTSIQFETSSLASFENVVSDGMTKIIETSPIGITSSGSETGVYRNNWQIGRTVSNRVLVSANKNKGRSYVSNKLKGKFKRGKNSKVYLFNNSPYARVIEYGGYPNPVQKGTYIRGVGYVKRSSGGFSKQAPSGHFRIGVINLKRNLKRVKGRIK